VNLWCAPTQVTGPYFFDEDITQTTHSYTWRRIMLFHGSTKTTILVLTLDGKPVQVAHSVRDCLNFNFRGQKIGTESPLHPLSSELRSLDLFLCLWRKGVQPKGQNAENSKHGSLQQVWRLLRTQHVWQEMQTRGGMQTEVQMVITVMCFRI